MVSTAYQMSRRSRSRTPSRVSTPIVKSAPAKKTTKKKAPTTRGRSKTPTRITTSTPKPKSAVKSTKKTPAKATSTKKTPSKKASESSKKRKNLDFSETEDDIDFPVTKKTKSPSGAAVSKATEKPKKSPKLSEAGSSGSGTVRRSRRIRDTTLNSIVEESLTSKGSLKDLSINGGVNQSSRNETINETQQGGKWGWFNCAIM